MAAAGLIVADTEAGEVVIEVVIEEASEVAVAEIGEDLDPARWTEGKTVILLFYPRSETSYYVVIPFKPGLNGLCSCARLNTF